ncbi:hypothetical protein [Clostridium sp.]|uniref:hypothetical protein n=1 Tax=Clostridium sp. TaxID=1506 RepID=UPI002630F8E7|nr:hypothetical protein [uncultured Clostridium sp.]
MGSDIIIGFIGIVLITLALIEFTKEMTLLKMECEGIEIENKVTNMHFGNVLFNK